MSTTTPFAPAAVKAIVSAEVLDKIDIRVGTIERVEDVANSNKLVKLTVNFGDHTRSILVGMKKERADPKAEIEGRQALFVVNLGLKKMAGETSEGMLFDIGYADGLVPVLSVPEKPIPNGARAGSRMTGRSEGPEQTVRILSPAGAITPTATWSVGVRAGDFVFVAGMRGIDPQTNALVDGEEARVRQAFLNMKLIAESEGASLRDAVRLVVYVTDMNRLRPVVNKVQTELWGEGPYPPRTIVEVSALAQDDIVEVEGTFYLSGISNQG